MSKGLGGLQRRILDCLVNPPAQPQVKHCPRLKLENGVYDLRIVARYVIGGDAAKLDVHACLTNSGQDCSYAQWRQDFLYQELSFHAAFSRAVRSLIERGELEDVRHVPLRNGKWSRQVRFVRLRSKAATK